MKSNHAEAIIEGLNSSRDFKEKIAKWCEKESKMMAKKQTA